MKKAAVDIGTNSIRLLIAEVDKKIERIEKLTTITRLGRGVDSSRLLSSDAIEKNLNVLMHYRSIADIYGISEIKAIATSAVRDALNREEFIQLARERAGINVDLISGEKEAELGFIGASSAAKGRACTVMDIGGGSTELITGVNWDIEISKSIDIGAVRITEKFFNSEVINNEDIQNARSYISTLGCEIIQNIRSTGPRELIGIGGTATTLAAIDMKLKVYDPDKVHGFKLSREDVDFMFQKLSSMSLNERKELPGLQIERADIIPSGALILRTIMEELGSEYVTVSEFDNLEGLLMCPISSNTIKIYNGRP